MPTVISVSVEGRCGGGSSIISSDYVGSPTRQRVNVKLLCITQSDTGVKKLQVFSQLQDETLKEEHPLASFPGACPDVLPGAEEEGESWALQVSGTPSLNPPSEDPSYSSQAGLDGNAAVHLRCFKILP